MWLFIHRPFEVWPWLGEYRIERVYMLGTIAYWAFCAPKVWASNRVNIGVFVLAISIALSTLVSQYTDFNAVAVQDWYKLLVFYVLVMSSVREERDLRLLVVGFVVVTGLYELHSLREYVSGRGVYRMGTWRMIGIDETMSDPNTFSATVNYALPMLFPVLALVKRRWHYVAIAGLFAMGVTCILLTGSRTGLVLLLLQAFAVVLFSKQRWKILLAVVIAAPLLWSLLPQDRQDRYLTIIDPSRGPAGAQQSAEGRTQGFVDGIRNWRSHPVFGVGPACHGAAIGHGMQSHNLYGQVLGELGSVGVLGLILLLVGYVGNFVEARRLVDPPLESESLFLYRVSFAVLWTAVLLLVAGWGGHNLFRYNWLWYGAFSALAVHFLTERYEHACGSDCDPLALDDDEARDLLEQDVVSSTVRT